MRLNRSRSRVATTFATIAVAAVALSACSGEDDTASGDSAPPEGGSASQSNEYPGEFTVQNGDSEFYVGDGPHRYTSVSAMCSESNGVITATVTESKSGNTFTTTQPAEGAGYSGGTLTMGDGTEYTWTPLDGITDEMYRNGEQIFEDETQAGSPVTWNADGTASLGAGPRVENESDQSTVVQVSAPGLLDCSNGAAIPE